MLTPFDRLQVDALLHQLPQRGQLAQEVHPILHRLQHIVDLALGREASDTEADTAVGILVVAAQRAEHVAGLQGRGRAGTARRQRNVLQSHQEGLALDVREGDVDASGVVTVGVAVQHGVLHRQKPVQQLLGEAADVLRVILPKKVSNSVSSQASSD